MFMPGISGIVGRLGVDLAAVTFVDHGFKGGTAANPSIHTSMSSDGPWTVVCVTWDRAGSISCTGCTFDGDAMTELTNEDIGAGSNDGGSAIFIIENSYTSKTISVAFDAVPFSCVTTVISLDNLASGIPSDTDFDKALTGNGDFMTALVDPGTNGVVIACFFHSHQNLGITWTNGSNEITDVSSGAHRHGVNVIQGNPSGNIRAQVANSTLHAITGVSLR